MKKLPRSQFASQKVVCAHTAAPIAITLANAPTTATKSNAEGVATGLSPLTLAGISESAANPYRILLDVYEQIKDALKHPEMGGILGADPSGTVVAFHFDATGTTTENQYTPDTEELNHVIETWFVQGVHFAGFVHTHNKCMEKLSWADTNYALTLKKVCPMESVLMLLYIPETKTFFKYVI